MFAEHRFCGTVHAVSLIILSTLMISTVLSDTCRYGKISSPAVADGTCNFQLTGGDTVSEKWDCGVSSTHFTTK